MNFNRDSFSVSSRSTTEPTMLRAGPENQPVVRLVAVNRSEVEHAPHPLLGILFHFIISRLIRFLSSSSIVIIYFVLPIRIFSESISWPMWHVSCDKLPLLYDNVNCMFTEVYQTKQPGESLYMESTETPIVVLETER